MFRCTARDLLDPAWFGMTTWLRVAADNDDPHAWHQVKTVRCRDRGFPVIIVAFCDATPSAVLHDTDQVEVAVIQLMLGTNDPL